MSRYWKASLIGILVLLIVTSRSAVRGDEPRSRLHWPFDEIRAGQTLDVVHNVGATVSGTYQLVAGVRGNALRFDGRTTVVRCPADKTPHLARAFTVDAWIAIRAYPWNRCAIIAQRGKLAAGFSLELDQLGRLVFQVAVDGHWQQCIAQQRLTLYQWHHVAGTWDAPGGITGPSLKCHRAGGTQLHRIGLLTVAYPRNRASLLALRSNRLLLPCYAV